MEPSRYYEMGKDETYCVHFPNKPGYSINEITNIFSEFGEVVGVTKAGDDYGFRFVRFTREEDVLRCIKSLKNHPKIRLLPKRQKSDNEQRKNWTNAQESRETKGNWADWKQKKSDNGGNFRRENGRRTANRDCDNHRFVDRATTEENEWDSVEKPQTCVDELPVPKINNETDLKKEQETQMEKLPEAQDIGIDVEPVYLSLQHEIAAGSVEIADSAKPAITSEGSCKSAKSSKTPLLWTVTVETIGESNVNRNEEISKNAVATLSQKIPLLILNNVPKLVEKPQKAEKVAEALRAAGLCVKMLEGEAIVVGNIHNEYGIHYILHLFQKHQPISVSPMKIITRQGLRYCIVYLQSSLQARYIEEEFDNYNLFGKHLIVMRAQKLLQLAGDA